MLFRDGLTQWALESSLVYVTVASSLLLPSLGPLQLNSAPGYTKLLQFTCCLQSIYTWKAQAVIS